MDKHTKRGVTSTENKDVKFYDPACADFRTNFGKTYPQVSETVLKQSLGKAAIPHLSACIKVLYYICMGVSVLGFAAALLIMF